MARVLVPARSGGGQGRSLAPTLLMLAGAGGGGGGTEIITPPPPPPVGFTLTFKADPEDAATAQALGWAAALPGLAVTVMPKDSSTAPRSFTSSLQGTVTISDLTAQDYIVEANRWLTDAERSKLTVPDDADGFVAKQLVRVTAASGQQDVPVPASRRKGLVISEWAFNNGDVPGLGAYPFGGFLELYNNADTTIYLDGMVVGRGVSADYDHPNFPCAVYAPFSLDPAGVWTLSLQAFPGQEREYPVAPGRTVVVATDAIDHRPFWPDALDLRSADFEFTGSADVDNPAVPNMVNAGFDPDLLGHGLYFEDLGVVAILARPLDYQTLTLTQVSRHEHAAASADPSRPAARRHRDSNELRERHT